MSLVINPLHEATGKHLFLFLAGRRGKWQPPVKLCLHLQHPSFLIFILNSIFRWKQFVKVQKFQSRSGVQLFGTPWTVPASLLCPWSSPGKNTGVGCHPDPGMESRSPALKADSLLPEPPGKHFRDSFYHWGTVGVGLPRCYGGKESACQARRLKR